MDGTSVTTRVNLGDPVPWFSGRTVAGAIIDLHVEAGRWVILAFIGGFGDPRTGPELTALLGEVALLGPDRMVLYVVFSSPPPDAKAFAALSNSALGFIADYNGAIAERFGAVNNPRTIVLDPLLCAIVNSAWDDPAGHSAVVTSVLRNLPAIDDSIGVTMTAPILVVPRVFEFELCDFLIDLYDSFGGTESGFLLEQAGKTTTIIDHTLKSRKDLVISDPELRSIMFDRVSRRLVPAVKQFFQFEATRMDRTLVSCYDANAGGHFFRHRDNLLAGTRHRRFAVSLGLNDDYEGGGIVFPEFGSKAYRPPIGGAIVFSTGMLHQVQPVTSGRRLVYVPFLYGEDDAATRLAENGQLADGSYRYQGGDNDRLPLSFAPERFG